MIALHWSSLMSWQDRKIQIENVNNVLEDKLRGPRESTNDINTTTGTQQNQGKARDSIDWRQRVDMQGVLNPSHWFNSAELISKHECHPQKIRLTPSAPPSVCSSAFFGLPPSSTNIVGPFVSAAQSGFPLFEMISLSALIAIHRRTVSIAEIL